MKVLVTKLSTMNKYRRWDANFYIGGVTCDDSAADVVKAEAALRNAASRLRTAYKKHRQAQARAQQMIADGEVIPIGGVNAKDQLNQTVSTLTH